MNGVLPRIARIVLVTLALSGAGAAAGVVISVGPIVVISLVLSGIAGMRDTMEVWPPMAAAGASLGAVLGPSLAWLLLRRVPLGVAILQCTLGGLVGLVVGVVLLDFYDRTHGAEMFEIMAALTGTVCAAVRLRLRNPPRASSLPRPAAPDT